MKKNKVSYLAACVAAGLSFCSDVNAMNWQQVVDCAGISAENVAPLRQVNNQQQSPVSQINKKKEPSLQVQENPQLSVQSNNQQRSVPQGNTQQQFVSQETASRLFGEVLAESENQANQIDRLKRENAQQVSDIEGFKESGIFKDARIDDLQRTSDFWENVANKQREKLGRASEHVNEKVHQIKALRRENAEQTDLINRLTGLVADKEDQIHRLRRENAQQADLIEKMKKTGRLKREEIRALKERDSELVRNLFDVRAEALRLRGENAEQTDLINRLTGLVASKEDRISELKRRTDRRTMQAGEFVERLKREKAEQAGQINRLIGENAQKADQLEQLKRENTQKLKVVKELETEKQNLQHELNITRLALGEGLSSSEEIKPKKHKDMFRIRQNKNKVKVNFRPKKNEVKVKFTPDNGQGAGNYQTPPASDDESVLYWSVPGMSHKGKEADNSSDTTSSSSSQSWQMENKDQEVIIIQPDNGQGASNYPTPPAFDDESVLYWSVPGMSHKGKEADNSSDTTSSFSSQVQQMKNNNLPTPPASDDEFSSYEIVQELPDEGKGKNAESSMGNKDQEVIITLPASENELFNASSFSSQSYENSNIGSAEDITSLGSDTKEEAERITGLIKQDSTAQQNDWREKSDPQLYNGYSDNYQVLNKNSDPIDPYGVD